MNCEACGCADINKFRDHIFDGDGQAFHLVECAACGLIWTDPMPSSEFLNKFYQQNFNYEWYKDHLNEKNHDAQVRACELKPHLGSSVLDFGGGYGYFSKSCVNLGLESEVFDPYAPVQKTNLSLDKKWDAVVSLHSLEHSSSPLQTLLQIKSLLNKNGRVVLVVPNSASRAYLKYGMGSVWAQPPFLHLFHFNIKSLTSLLNKAGFEVSLTYVSDRWDANYICDVVFRKYFSKIDDFWGKIQNKTVRHVYAVATGLLRRFAFIIAKIMVPASLQDEELTIIARPL